MKIFLKSVFENYFLKNKFEDDSKHAQTNWI